MKSVIDALIAEWPVILTALTGVIVAFLVYLKTKIGYKTKVIEKENENLKLQELIAAGSYIICPECGHKIFLTEARIFTGGKNDEK